MTEVQTCALPIYGRTDGWTDGQKGSRRSFGKDEKPPFPKGARRPDILVERLDGSQYGINVGKTTAKGAPIKREVEALYDLEDVGLPMYYVSYDK